MSRALKPEADVVPRHVVFERRTLEAYRMREDVPVRVVFERRTPDTYQAVEEDTLEATPLLERELPLVALEPLLEDEARSAEGSECELEDETEILTSCGETTRVRFRQAWLDVDDPETFWAGVVGGQVTAVEESRPLTGTQVFALFEDAVRDLEFSETWLAGYFLGLSDALLRQRKVYPRAYATRLKPLRKRRSR
jgi:hypothetical protein